MRKSALMVRLFAFVRPLAGVMLCTVAIGVLGFLSAIGISVVSGYGALIAVGKLPGRMGTVFAILAVCAVSRGLLRYVEQYSGHYIAFRLLALFRDRVFAALRRLAPAKLEQRQSGDLVAVITSDIEALEVFYAHTIAPVAIAGIVSLVMALFIGRFHPAQGLLAAAAYLCVGWIAPRLLSQKDSGQAYRGEFARLMSYFLDGIRGIREVLQFGLGEARLREIDAQSQTLNGIAGEMKSHENRVASAMDLLVALFSLGMALLSVALYAAGAVDFAGLLIPIVAMFSSFGAVIAVGNLSHGLVNTFAAARRIFDILDERPAVEEVPGEAGAALSPEVGFDGVRFAYQSEAVLDRFELAIGGGEFVGFRGASGSGKSTALKLIMRFWDVQSGKVTLGGRDVRDLPTRALRGQISFLAQETYIFNDTIRENIRLGRPDADEAQVMEAAKKASLHAFISGLDKGYDTPSGELGERFSSGECQRIGLARMFLHDAPVLLLDEPTSNIDILNENIVLASLNENRAHKTIVVASHKASTLEKADRVVEFGKPRQ